MRYRQLRTLIALSGASILAACGGDTAPQSAGSIAPPTGGTPTPTPAHSFVNPTETKTYEGLGGVQHYAYSTDSRGVGQYSQLYAGDANTVRDSGISVTYNPRDAIFELTINRPNGIVNIDAFRFQDPAHRTDFGGARQPQAGVPQLSASRQIQYLQTGSSSGNALTDPANPFFAGAYNTGNPSYIAGQNQFTSTTQTFFYQKPGTTTRYVTYAGFVRNSVTAEEVQPDPTIPPFLRQNYSLDRAAFVFGERTANSAVPTSGSGTFAGEMVATLVFNPELDTNAAFPTYFQWIEGTQTTTIDFATLGVTTNMTGTVFGPTYDAYTSFGSVLPNGSTFTAVATSLIDLVNKGGFTGKFTSARFTRPGLSDFVVNIAGSSIDGAFFGPNGEEIGGGFRVVGGTPDERIDILGAFTGKK